MTETLVIAGTADDKFCMGICVMVASLAINASIHRIDFYWIDAGVSAQNRARVIQTMEKHNVKIYWLTPDHQKFESVPLSGHISIASYYRLSLASLIPQQISRVIYLDADMVVLADIAKLWRQGPSKEVLRAVTDQTIRQVSHPMGLKNYQALGIVASRAYFNAGFLDINLDEWRSRNISSKLFQYLHENSDQIRWHDQDVLNAVLAEQWEELPARWNRPITIHRFNDWQDSPYAEDVFQALLTQPAVIHFTESGKPWTPGFQHPERQIFFNYLQYTAWNPLKVQFDLLLKRLQARVLKYLFSLKQIFAS